MTVTSLAARISDDRLILDELSKMSKVNQRITNEASGLRIELAHVRSDFIRWMFAFWVGQTVVVATLFTLLM